MEPRWLTAFIDRPPDTFDDAVRFWSTVTGSSVSPPRGDHGEFATLVSPDGDAYLRVQRLADGVGGSHLDVHVDDINEFAAHAVAMGAEEQADRSDVVVLRSPAGMAWCVVAHHGEATRPAPQPVPDGHVHLVDQLCIDIPSSRFDDECSFWAAVTGWPLRQSTVRSEFAYLERPGWCPLRLLLQRCGDERPARGHLDLASSDVDAIVAHHVEQGSTVQTAHEHWTVLTDPSGVAYCVTARDPASGVLS